MKQESFESETKKAMTTTTHQPRQREHSRSREDQAGLSLWQVICSVFAAGFGVQSKENKVRDFSSGRPHQFIIVGVLFTMAFMLGLIAIINIIV